MASEDKGAYREIESGSQSAPKMSVFARLGTFFDREFKAEFLSTLILVLLGNGSVAQFMLLNKDTPNSAPFLTINFGYGCAVMFGAYIAAGVSGAHMNPAVSIALAVVKKFSWFKVPKYITAQMLGALIGSFILFIVYVDRLLEAGTLLDNDLYRGIFATYPHGGTSVGPQLLDQVVGTFLLMLIVCSLIDTNNSAPPPGVTPILVGGSVLSIGLSFGTNCGYAINPARDFAPRLATAIMGYDNVFSANEYYFWIPIVGPIIGAILGAAIYLLFIERPNSCLSYMKEPTDIVTSNGASVNEADIQLEKKTAA